MDATSEIVLNLPKNLKTAYPDSLYPVVKNLARNAYEKSAYYKWRWEGLYDPNTFNDWPDFLKLKPSDKSLFKAENIAVENNKIAYYFFSGGSTGNPKIIPVTKQEWRNRDAYRANCYRLIGISKFDSVWIALPFGPWAAGHSAQHAFHILRSNVLPAGLSNDQNIMKHIWYQAKRMNINVIATTPSILKFIESSIGNNSFFPIEKVITTGEFISDPLKDYYKSKFGIDVFASYGSSECFIGIECSRRCGYHFDPKEIFIETVDKNNKTTNETGSILLTNLNSEAIPLIRYKIGDLGKIHYKKCACGSDWPRIEWLGRDNDFYEISGGVNFHTYQLADALSVFGSSFKKCELILKDGPAGKDIIEITVYFHEKEVVSAKQKLSLTKKVTKVIQNLSLDFNDVMFEGYAKVSITVKGTAESSLFQKVQIQVRDLRKFRR